MPESELIMWKRMRVIPLIAAGAAVLITACSSSSSSNSSAPTSSSSGSSGTASVQLKQAGVLNIAADFSVPPNQYISNSNHEGIDVDLCSAIASQLSLKVSWTNLPFDSLISGLQANRYDALCTGVFITAAREQVMNMVPYVQWGVTMGVTKSAGTTYDCTPQAGDFQPCFAKFSGKTVATEAGGFEEQLLEAANSKLQAAGKAPVKILAFAQTTQAWQAFTNGTAQGVWVDDPQFYFLNTNNGDGQYVAAFGGDDPTPLALTTTIQNKSLAQAFVRALQTLKSDGMYASILKKWHVQSVPSFTINPPVAS
jgi:polar amino acid transport system substrate-binding protein